MNAKKEFIGATEGHNIVCATIRVGDKEIFLKKGYTTKEFEEFLNKLDFYYYSGYGLQKLYGNIWCDKGWFERWEYDGSEGWDFIKRPKIPKVLEGE
jgi:hypothetical protein